MPWVNVPVLGGIGNAPVLANDFAEVRAAIIERQGISGTAGILPVSQAVADGAQARALLTEYRAKIDLLCVDFGNVDFGGDGEAWTPATVKTATLGRVNWLPNTPDGAMYDGEINELRLVLNALMWLRLPEDAGTRQTEMLNPPLARVVGESNVSWNLAWTAAKAAYNPPAWGGAFVSFFAGFITQSFTPGATLLYEKDIYHYRVTDVRYTIPGGVAVTATRIRLASDGAAGPGVGNLNLYEQANFAGAPIAINNFGAPTGYTLVACSPVTAGAQHHYSLRTNPASLVGAEDPYEAPDVDSAAGGYLCGGEDGLLVRYNFEYQ